MSGFVLKYQSAAGQITLVDALRPMPPFSGEVFPLGPSGQQRRPHMDTTNDASGQGIYWSPESGEPTPPNPFGLPIFPSHVGGVYVGPGSPAYIAWLGQPFILVDIAMITGQTVAEYLALKGWSPTDGTDVSSLSNGRQPAASTTPGAGASDDGPYAVGGPGGVGYVGGSSAGAFAPQPNPLIEAIARGMGLTYAEYMAKFDGSASVAVAPAGTPGTPAASGAEVLSYQQGRADEKARILLAIG